MHTCISAVSTSSARFGYAGMSAETLQAHCGTIAAFCSQPCIKDLQPGSSQVHHAPQVTGSDCSTQTQQTCQPSAHVNRCTDKKTHNLDPAAALSFVSAIAPHAAVGSALLCAALQQAQAQLASSSDHDSLPALGMVHRINAALQTWQAIKVCFLDHIMYRWTWLCTCLVPCICACLAAAVSRAHQQ
jgi:hypothetical protein